jgi:Secretion system C-terminal sorting domain/Putative binding domain, N-terminal
MKKLIYTIGALIIISSLFGQTKTRISTNNLVRKNLDAVNTEKSLNIEPYKIDIVEIEGRKYYKKYMSAKDLVRKYGEVVNTKKYKGYYLQEVPKDINKEIEQYKNDPLVDSIVVVDNATALIFMTKESLVNKYGKNILDSEDGEYQGFIEHFIKNPSPLLPININYPNLPELIEKRRPNSRTFIKENSTYVDVVSVIPTSYYLDGQWVDIDPSIPLTEEANSSLEDYLNNISAQTTSYNYYGLAVEVENDGLKPYTFVYRDAENYANCLGSGKYNSSRNKRYYRQFLQIGTDSSPDISDVTKLEFETYITDYDPHDYATISVSDYFQYYEVWAEICELSNKPENYFDSYGDDHDLRTWDLFDDCWDGTIHYDAGDFNWDKGDGYKRVTLSNYASNYSDGYFTIGLIDLAEQNQNPIYWEAIVIRNQYSTLYITYLVPDLDVVNISNPMNVGSDGGSDEGRVYNDGGGELDWNTTISDNWIHVSQPNGDNISGGNYHSVTITVDENTSTTSRPGSVVFYNENDTSDKETIEINQEAPKGSISGHIYAENSTKGIENVEIKLTGPSNKISSTNSEGYYEFSELNYASNYKVTPVLSGHEFTPSSRDIDLYQSSYPDVDFEDGTPIDISGKVTYQGINYPVEGVNVYCKNQNMGWITDVDGQWSGQIKIGEEFYLEPKFGDYTFAPSRYPESGFKFLLEDNNSINFEVTTKYKLTLKSETNCGGGINGVTFNVTTVGFDYPHELNTNENGIASIDLPPLRYKITAEKDGKDEWFSNQEIIFPLTQDTTITFTPTTDIVLEIKNLPVVYNNDKSDSIYSIYHGDSTQLIIDAKDTEGCPAKSVNITIIDDVADISSEPITVITDEEGIALYYLKGGRPAYDNAPKYTKSITFSSLRGDYTTNSNNTVQIPVVVTGETLINESFITGLPEIPIKIIHDPNGDNSYSFFQEESEVTQEVNLTLENSEGKSVEAKVGFNVFGIGAEIGGEIKSNLSDINGESWAITIDEKDLKTSSIITNNSSSIGPGQGDIYVGLGMNILYGLAKEVILEDIVAKLDTNLYWQPNWNAVTYMYSADYIKNTILKRDCDLLELYEDDEWLYEPHETRERWEKVLHMNMGLDNQISPDEESFVQKIEQLHFAGGGTYQHEYTISRTTKQTITSTEILESTILAGLDIGGIVSSSCNLNISVGKTTSESYTNTNSETIGYYIHDDENEDSFNITFYRDLVFGTLLFTSENSNTSCPWEKQTGKVQGVSINNTGEQVVAIRTNECASFSAEVINQNNNENADNQFKVFIPTELNPSLITGKINGKDEDIVRPPYGDKVPIGISACYDISTTGDTCTFAVVAQALLDDQIGDTLYYTIVWDHVVPPVDFIIDTNPYGNTFEDTIEANGECDPAYIWGESLTDLDPDSVVLNYRFRGNKSWTKLGKMEELYISGHSHNYYRFEHQPGSLIDSTFYEYKLTAMKNNATRNSESDYLVCFCPRAYTDIVQFDKDIPSEHNLDQNYPNPFNPTTAINYQLPTDSDVELSIFDMNGKKVATLVNEAKLAGYYTANWYAFNVSSGIYFYRLQAGDFIDTKKMVFMK